MTDTLHADDLTREDVRTAFDVIERAREHAAENNYEPEQTVLNDAHHWLQEYVALCVKRGAIEQPYEQT